MNKNVVDRPADMVPARREGAVVVLSLNFPARRNALCFQMRSQLVERLSALMADRTCRAIVLTGVDGHFSAGGDISEMKQRPILESRNRWDLTTTLVRHMATGPKPIVGAIEGVAVGAGLALVALCDYSVAARSAKFNAAFAKVGVLPDAGALWSVPRKVGIAKAQELFGLARPFDADAALRMGLVNELAEPGAALQAALVVAQEYAQMPPLAMAMIKSVMAEGMDSLAAALRSEVDSQPMLATSRDHQEAVAAFLEKRTPRFIGE